MPTTQEVRTRYTAPFWKPYQGKGAAAIFEYSPTRSKFYLIMMSENPDGSFNHDDRIASAIGKQDVGEILLVLKGISKGLGKFQDNKYGGLYHKNENGHSATYLEYKEDGKFRLALFSKKNDKTKNCQINLTPGEAQQLELFITNPYHPLFTTEKTFEVNKD